MSDRLKDIIIQEGVNEVCQALSLLEECEQMGVSNPLIAIEELRSFIRVLIGSIRNHLDDETFCAILSEAGHFYNEDY